MHFGVVLKMIRKAKFKRTVIILGVLFSVSLIAIAAVFGVHYTDIKRYNTKKRTIEGSSSAEGVITDIRQRGQKTDSWVKNDEALGAPLNGIIYELTVSNGSKSIVKNWQLRLDIQQDCYINNAWCGEVEIHQLRNGSEKSQRLDLRNCSSGDIELEHIFSAGDILISLQPGDYIIYYPSAEDKETPIAKGGNRSSAVSTGFIFYSYSTSVNLSERTLDYFFYKDYKSGVTASICHIFMIVWILLLIGFIAVALLIVRYERKLLKQEKRVRESLDVFSSFVDAKDPYTYGHSKRVAYYSRKIAERLGFSDEECKRIYQIALLHDIGKCYVPDEILKKPSGLTDEEYGIIKAHAAKGAEMVKELSSIPGIYEGVLYHHERYDGKGYPTGKKGRDIPISARIISVADAYDSMSSNRVYRSRLSKERVLNELKENRGSQFDPDIVDAFLEVLEEQERVSGDKKEKTACADSGRADI